MSAIGCGDLRRLERDPRRGFHAEHFGMTRDQLRKCFGDIERLDQLDACKDDAARRLLLGRSEKQGVGIKEQGSGRQR